MRYCFDDVELDTEMFELRVGGERVPVEPQVFEVLAYLVEQRGRLVARTEILDTIWGDRFVSDAALASRIAAARAAIGDDGKTQRYIRTVHGRGVQFIGTVAAVDDATDRGSRDGDAVELQQTIRFVAAPDGHRLAVGATGTGRPLVKAANWLTHVEHDWRSPVWHHWLTELGRRFHFVRYDARGSGLTDRDLTNSDMTDPELWADDLEAVVDATTTDPVVLLGVSQGAVPAIVYAQRRPDRVSHLVLFGAYADGMRLRGEQARAESDTLLQLIRAGWGGSNPAFRTVFTMNFMPSATSEHMRVFNDVQISSADAANALELEAAFHELDVGALAAGIEVPTLVMHCRNDHATPYDQGRRLAASIPGAEFVTIESENHILTADEPGWIDFLGHIERFTST